RNSRTLRPRERSRTARGLLHPVGGGVVPLAYTASLTYRRSHADRSARRDESAAQSLRLLTLVPRFVRTWFTGVLPRHGRSSKQSRGGGVLGPRVHEVPDPPVWHVQQTPHDPQQPAPQRRPVRRQPCFVDRPFQIVV